MLGATAGFGEVGVRVFQNRVLVAMAELTGEAGVSIVMVLFLFGRAFRPVGIIIRNLGHGTFPFRRNIFVDLRSTKLIRRSVRWKKPRVCASARVPAELPENAGSVG